MAHIQLIGLSKRFGPVTAVDRVSLEIHDGEFFTLLGPSGCGKTTTLRAIAGLETPDEGQIVVDGKDITYLPANRRRVGMVFQNYALFPHMNVFENVAFGLRARGEPAQEIAHRVRQSLALVRLDGFADRKPGQLSGGQQQRVALARALACRPEILLLDEPLSNLDAKLREETRTEIQRLQKESGITTVYVTHDQSEALALSDRIAVMNNGRLEQVGTPAEIYGKPATAFVARFIGQVNVLAGTVQAVEGSRVLVDLGVGRLWAERPRSDPPPVGKTVQVCIHPENLEPAGADSSNGLEAQVELVQFNGVTTLLRFRAGAVTLEAIVLSRSPAAGLRRGMSARLTVAPEHVLILDDAS
ncbi:MAG: ABC transporter ATP-binding protein [Firmicutes bacterium]|nr:ABC transporter ATP-binding protein [Bacillota bacterium]